MKLKIYYEDILVGEVLTNGPHNAQPILDEALKIIGFEEEKFVKEQGFDDIDYNDFKLVYSSSTLVGLSEAAETLGWSKQQVSVYLQRGKFPDPLQRLASGPIWTLQQIEDYRDARK